MSEEKSFEEVPLVRSKSSIERRLSEIEALKVESDNNLDVLVEPSNQEPGAFTVRVFPNIGAKEG